MNTWQQYLDWWMRSPYFQWVMDAARESAGLNRMQVEGTLALNRAELNARIQYQKGQLAIERERLAIERGQAAADKWYREQQVELAKATLGLQYLEQAARLGGPSDYFQYLDFIGGARANPKLPNWLDALNRNVQQRAWGAPDFAQGTSPQTMASLTQALGGGGSADQAFAQGAGWDPDRIRALGVIARVGMNPAGLAPGTLESLGPDERDVLFSGLRYLGFSPESVVDLYNRSRINQGNPAAA